MFKFHVFFLRVAQVFGPTSWYCCLLLGIFGAAFFVGSRAGSIGNKPGSLTLSPSEESDWSRSNELTLNKFLKDSLVKGGI